ncbi:hypothetical protein IAQ61_009642 [Plenodomus lingam]|uniref:uncharacterized protein n=1 Tax=Leptosphaeria maculans TaxID=5022 RepID=UPI0033308129|nr:hypothetical protein IAQ61_009642 [Plenodomus lingam]
MVQTDSVPPKPFRAIIIGAGFAGLALSHAFQLANIDHIVLEKHHEIVSVRGAAVVIWHGVARIFDQFGFLDKIHKSISPVQRQFTRWPDGSVHQSGTSVRELDEMFQTEMIVTNRGQCVSHLYENLPDKSRVHGGRKLDYIEHTANGVRVHFADGSFEEGDIVIGADGVHSHVRSEMWNYASKFDQTAIPDSDKSALFTQYRAFFVTAPQKESFGLSAADFNHIFGQDVTKLLFTQSGKAYCTIIFKGEFSQPPKKNLVTQEIIDGLAQRFAKHQLTETLTFGDLWENKESHGLLNIEEGILQKWHAGRMVLVGDSAWKMTSELGAGANMAIESAVSLANILHRNLKDDRNRHFTQSELSALFTEYQNDRFDRVKDHVDRSGQATRAFTYQSLISRFMVGYVGPWMHKSQVKQLAESLTQAPKLDYVPLRTLNEDAEGWKLVNKIEKKSAEIPVGGWLKYVLFTCTVGAAIAYRTVQPLQVW